MGCNVVLSLLCVMSQVSSAGPPAASPPSEAAVVAPGTSPAVPDLEPAPGTPTDEAELVTPPPPNQAASAAGSTMDVDQSDSPSPLKLVLRALFGVSVGGSVIGVGGAVLLFAGAMVAAVLAWNFNQQSRQRPIDVETFTALQSQTQIANFSMYVLLALCLPCLALSLAVGSFSAVGLLLSLLF